LASEKNLVRSLIFVREVYYKPLAQSAQTPGDQRLGGAPYLGVMDRTNLFSNAIANETSEATAREEREKTVNFAGLTQTHKLTQQFGWKSL
jgi:hypothetical protein